MNDPETVAREELEAVWMRGDLAAIDRLYAEDCVDHNGALPGRDGVKAALLAGLAVFGEMKFDLDLVFASGELVARRWTMTAIHKGAFMGVAATGRRVTVTGIDLLRVRDGRIVELWHNEDFSGLTA